MSRDREQTIAFVMQYCQHYRPGGITMIGGKEPDGVCEAGVNYEAQFPNSDKSQPAYYGVFQRICCTSGGKRSEEEQIASCPKWARCTREQGEARADDFDGAMRQMKLVGPVVSAWRKKLPRGKSEIIECPACKGRLHLSQAACNGHVHGHCETEDCVSWME